MKRIPQLVVKDIAESNRSDYMTEYSRLEKAFKCSMAQLETRRVSISVAAFLSEIRNPNSTYFSKNFTIRTVAFRNLSRRYVKFCLCYIHLSRHTVTTGLYISVSNPHCNNVSKPSSCTVTRYYDAVL